ncbi:hypothetical protein Glove_232g134 [Diversispora epigaea]|uniref:Uncharacterized protein n=1 Tax=Diversispora epigaea TaxID=1348612 RepID=A0A397IHE7_9GLOM|nr:hypothetical protein Glove_232g134 [Diversispora epigaea]
MGSSNFTLNRHFIVGIPGLSECPDEKYPDLIYSFCLGEKKIISHCIDLQYSMYLAQFYSDCPDNFECIDFATDPGPSVPLQYENFAICVDEEFIKKYKHDKDGVFCQTYVINGVTGEIATISINVYDSSSNPVKIRSIGVTTGTQYGSKQNMNSYSKIINCKNGQKIKVCTDIAVAKVTLFAMFTFLDRSYSFSN